MKDEDVESISNTILGCIELQRQSEVRSLFNLMLCGQNVGEVSKGWFCIPNGTTPPQLTYKMRCETIKRFCWAAYFLVEEVSDEDELIYKDHVFDFLLESNLVMFITGILHDGDESETYRGIQDSSVTFIVMYFMKRILKLNCYEKSKYTKKLLQNNAVEIVLDLISQESKNLIFVAAIDVLRCFCLNHREACERIVNAEGHLLLAPLLHKDLTQKLILSYGMKSKMFELEGKIFQYQLYDIKCCIDLAFTTWNVPETIDQLNGLTLIHTGFELKKAAMQIMMFIADMNNRFRTTLYNTTSCMKSLVGWLRNPSSDPSTHIMFQMSSHILCNMMISEQIVLKLIKEHKFVEFLDIGLYSAGWHISRQFQMLVCEIAKHGGAARDALAANKGIFEMLICQVYSIDEEVQPCLMKLLVFLSQARRTAIQFHEAGMTPQVLMDTGHFYGHAYKDSISQVRDGFATHIKSWRREENQLNKDAHVNIDEEKIRNEVEQLKALGNENFKEDKYVDAAMAYTEALKICPIRIKCPDGEKCPSWNERMKKNTTNYHWWVIPATLFANRAQCNLKLKNWKKVITDCTKSICSCWIPCDEGGPGRQSIFFKAVYRRSRAWYELKEYHKALNDISCCHELEPQNDAITQFYKECMLLYRKKYGRELVRHCGNCGAGEGIDVRRCASCVEVYCSKKCQLMDWETGHQLLCEKVNSTKIYNTSKK